jgi:predicted outer membrane repeat protein
MYLIGSSPILTNCILSGNSADQGGAIFCAWASYPLLTCCDSYCNVGGNWSCVGGQQGVNGNFSECPLFCDPANDDYHLQVCSPCAAGYGCGQIGAYGVGCACGEPTAVEVVTWSSLKALFR